MVLPCSAVAPPDDSVPVSSPVTYSLSLDAYPREYTAAISSVPGINLTVNWTPGVPPEKIRYEWNTTAGRFMSWEAPLYQVQDLGSSTSTRSVSLYWSYPNPDPVIPVLPDTITITLDARDAISGDIIANTTCFIQWKDNMAIVMKQEG